MRRDGFFNVPSPGCGFDPFSRGRLFSPERNSGGGTLHRGQAWEAFVGAGDIEIHCGGGNQASGQGSQAAVWSTLMFSTAKYPNFPIFLPPETIQTAKRLKSKPQDALEGVVLSVSKQGNGCLDINTLHFIDLHLPLSAFFGRARA